MKEKTTTSKFKNVSNLQMTFQIRTTGEEGKVV